MAYSAVEKTIEASSHLSNKKWYPKDWIALVIYITITAFLFGISWAQFITRAEVEQRDNKILIELRKLNAHYAALDAGKVDKPNIVTKTKKEIYDEE